MSSWCQKNPKKTRLSADASNLLQHKQVAPRTQQEQLRVPQCRGSAAGPLGRAGGCCWVKKKKKKKRWHWGCSADLVAMVTHWPRFDFCCSIIKKKRRNEKKRIFESGTLAALISHCINTVKNNANKLTFFRLRWFWFSWAAHFNYPYYSFMNKPCVCARYCAQLDA